MGARNEVQLDATAFFLISSEKTGRSIVFRMTLIRRIGVFRAAAIIPAVIEKPSS